MLRYFSDGAGPGGEGALRPDAGGLSKVGTNDPLTAYQVMDAVGAGGLSGFRAETAREIERVRKAAAAGDFGDRQGRLDQHPPRPSDPGVLQILSRRCAEIAMEESPQAGERDSQLFRFRFPVEGQFRVLPDSDRKSVV